MKFRTLLPLMLFLVTGSLFAQNKQGAKIQFDEDTHDFGVLKRGPVAIDTFWFTNTGDEDLHIQGVAPSCACTNVEWSKYPVRPGQKGWIQLGLVTKEQHGIFNKVVYIQSTATDLPKGEKRYRIYIKGDARD